MKMIRWLGFLVAAAVSVTMAITTAAFRFRNPTLTETQLLQSCGVEFLLMGAGGVVAALLLAPHETTKR